MPPRSHTTLAIVASLTLHAALGLALAHFPCRNAPLAASATGPTYVIHAISRSLADSEDKLLPQELAGRAATLPSAATLSLAPAPEVSISPLNDEGGTEFSVPLLTPAASQTGSALSGPKNAGPWPSLPLPKNAGAPNGAGATTTFFGLPTHSQKIVYVLDRSASMGLNGALDTAKKELLASVDQLPATAQFQVVIYNSTAQVLVGREEKLLPTTPENVARAAEALNNLEQTGGTKHLPALTLALHLRADVIYFLTDADDLDPADLSRILQINPARAVFHCIELTKSHLGQATMPMQVLARTTGGSYQALDLTPPR